LLGISLASFRDSNLPRLDFRAVVKQFALNHNPDRINMLTNRTGQFVVRASAMGLISMRADGVLLVQIALRRNKPLSSLLFDATFGCDN
jgi:hypothetical protein